MFNPFVIPDALRLFQLSFTLLFVAGAILILGLVIGFFIGVVVTDSELGDMMREYFHLLQTQRDDYCDY